MAYKPTILQVKDPSTGQWIPIPAITGGDGRSAYQVAVDNGYTGTEAQWIESLKGENGVSIQNISGNADGSWTITYTNGTSETISNGAYISLVNELQRAKHTTMAVEITDDGFGGYNSSVNDNDINNHRNAGGVVFCYYHNSANNVTYTYWYSNMEPDRKPTFLRTYIDEAGKVKQVLISVDNAKKATVVFRTASVPIDPTLTQPNQAADAKAVGDVLDRKLDKDGEWEEIKEIVADTPNYDIDEEPDGTKYNFKKIELHFEAPEGSPRGNLFVYTSISPSIVAGVDLQFFTNRYYLYRARIENGELIPELFSSDSRNHFLKAEPAIRNDLYPIIGKSIKKVKMSGLTAGTKIRIRAVRAKE